MRGAGGTPGGSGQFLLGLIMFCGGAYLLLNAIHISSSFGFATPLFGLYGGYSLTSGMVMLPFLLGVGMVFYNARNVIGWLLAAGSLVALVFAVIASIQFSFRSMSAFDLIVILVLTAGGLGLLLRSLRSH
ncbi:hypothetical protein [Chitinimonas sp.]|uniref:hypothetical protein n=1 Tax=Chitinimonas sp. TaxID=1934313 RepID=UPI0035B39E68